MSENAIELEPVGNLLGKNFFIPNYQRGYRWKEQQVKNLLDDIEEFIELQKKSEKNDGFYCIQPLVVKGISNKDAAQNIRNAVKNGEPSDDKDFIQYVKNETQIAQWEVIDGQQRLTTIFILLSYLEEKNLYKLEYETRKTTGSDSADFLNNIANKTEKDCTNIDFYYMYNAYQAIKSWFEPKDEQVKVKDEKKKSDEAIIDSNDKENENQKDDADKNKKLEEFKQNFKDTLLNQVKFIWYESTDEDPIKVFTRLNIGKISLTNAELIKALFLNRSNFSEKEYADIRLKQQEIASEWDKIEYTLQNEEFWLFLNQRGYDKPTRIDMIFDLICGQDILKMYHKKENNKEVIDTVTLEKACGTDQYKTFRYFYNFFKLKKENSPASLNEPDKSKIYSAAITDCWSKVKEVFQIFEEWYNDLELYHYVGYLVDQGEKIYDRTNKEGKKITGLLTLWMTAESKQDFIGVLKEKIKGKISNCNVLTQQYEVENKTNCTPLILLHNVQTVINQNSNTEDAYKLSAFYKFPFHLYKSENWDVEHIDSNTENNLEDFDSQKEWLKDISLDIPNDDEYKELADEIRKFIKNNPSDEKSKEQDNTFKGLCEKVEEYSPSKSTDRLQENNNDIDEKNMIWNYCLLDRSTNRSNGNAVFSVKRRAIIAKDQGKTFVVNDDLSISSEDSVSAFVLPCTKNVFLKYYNPSTNVLRAWTREDAKEYLLNINDVLSKAGFISNQQTKIDTMYKGEK